jgi:membrane protease YdiL (CAAX protease family)
LDEVPYVRPVDRHVGPLVALIAWASAWFAGQILGAAVLPITGHERADDAPIVVILAALVLAWCCYLGAMAYVSARFGASQFAVDYGYRAKRRDIVGIAIGVLCQIVLIPAVYLPLQSLWPETFSGDRVQDNAAGLASRAAGVSSVMLVAAVAIGAPIVEELVYRGLIQRSLASRLSDAVAVTATASLFTLIHFRPVEYPGLFTFSIVLGLCAAVTRRLGLSIFVHVGFNATGLVLVMR